MSKKSSKRRMAENEVVFREYNERVKRSFDELKDLAKDAGQESFVEEDDMPLYFYCECSDENCLKRVLLKPSHYTEIHKDRDRFVVVNGHESEEIERVIDIKPRYSVVEKLVPVPEFAPRLNKTPVENI